MDRTFDHRNEQWGVILGPLTDGVISPGGFWPAPTSRRVWFLRASDGREYYGKLQPTTEPTDDNLRAALDVVLTRHAKES